MNNANQYDLCFVGDTMLSIRRGNAPPFGEDINRLLLRASHVIVNLETTIGEAGAAKCKSVLLRSAPANLRYLAQLNRCAANLANNHIFDFGEAGAEGTLRHLRQSRISYFGLHDKNAKRQPFVIPLDQGKLVLLGYSEAPEKMGRLCIHGIDHADVASDIAAARKNGARWVALSLHWGEEYVSYPTRAQQRLARAFIEAGADAIIGHHPHVIQGFERYRNGLIFYSLGNFNFGLNSDATLEFHEARIGLAVFLKFTAAGIDYEVRPVSINADFQPELMPAQSEEETLEWLCRLSQPIRQGISECRWLGSAVLPYFKNHLYSFKLRIARYGVKEYPVLMKWLVHPRRLKHYLGLLTFPIRYRDPRGRMPGQCPKTA